jgi:hypothetical protein
MLVDALDEHPLATEMLLIVTSPRGYPLGEHRRIGSCDAALYGELLHVPLLVRFPHGEHAMMRSRRILQPHEVFSIVANTCGWTSQNKSQLVTELEGELSQGPAAAYVSGSQQRAIRTPAWFMRDSESVHGVQRELFVKPDDRCEANEVSSRCGEVVDVLAAAMDGFESAARQGRLADTPPLAEVLCDIWR